VSDSSIEPSALHITWKNGWLNSHYFKHEAQSINQSINPTLFNQNSYISMATTSRNIMVSFPQQNAYFEMW